MDKLGLGLIIGAVASPSIGKAFAGIKSQAKSTTSAVEKLDIGKAWGEKLTDLQKKIKANESLMTRLGRTTQGITLNDKLRRDLDEARRQAAEFGINLGNAAEKSRTLAKEIAKIKAAESLQSRRSERSDERSKLGMSLAKTGAAAYGYKRVVDGFIGDAVKFETGMAQTATLLDGGIIEKSARIKILGTDIKRLMKETGKDAGDLQLGLYQTVSAFGDNATSAKKLEIAVKGAVAGGATTAESINLMSTVTKGFGDTSEEASKKAMGLAFQTVKLGQTTFPELAASIGRTIPLAATMKVKQEELFGAIATLTGVTGNTAEVNTQLTATMQSFMEPNDKMTKALKRLGYANGQAALDAEGLGGILKKLKQEVKGNDIAFAGFFGSVEAKKAVLPLAGAQAADFAEKTAKMKDGAIAFDAAYAEMANTTEFRMNKMKQTFAVASQNIGMAVMPVYEQLGMGAAWLGDKIEYLTSTYPQMTSVIVIGTGALIAFKMAVIGAKMIKSYGADVKDTIKFVRDFSDSKTVATVKTYAFAAAQKVAAGATALWSLVTKGAVVAQKLMNAAWAASPIGLIVLGITALGALAYTVYKNWEPIVKWFKDVFSSIGSAISSIFGTDDKKLDAKVEEKIQVETKPVIGDAIPDDALKNMQKPNDFNTEEFSKNYKDAGSLPLEKTGQTSSKSISITIQNFTVQAANIDESLPKIIEKVKAALKQAAQEEMGDSYAASVSF